MADASFSWNRRASVDPQRQRQRNYQRGDSVYVVIVALPHDGNVPSLVTDLINRHPHLEARVDHNSLNANRLPESDFGYSVTLDRNTRGYRHNITHFLSTLPQGTYEMYELRAEDYRQLLEDDTTGELRQLLHPQTEQLQDVVLSYEQRREEREMDDRWRADDRRFMRAGGHVPGARTYSLTGGDTPDEREVDSWIISWAQARHEADRQEALRMVRAHMGTRHTD